MHPLPLDDCLIDSPSFRAVVGEADKQTIALSRQLKALGAIASDYGASGAKHSNTATSLADAISAFGSTSTSSTSSADGGTANPNDTEGGYFSSAMRKFGETLSEIERYREMLFLQTDALLTTPLHTYATADLGAVEERRAMVAQQRHLFETQSERYGSLPPSTAPNAHRDAFASVQQARADYAAILLSHVAQLNDIGATHEHQVIEKVLNFVAAQRAFFAQGHALMVSLEPFAEECFNRLRVEKQNALAVKKDHDIRRNALRVEWESALRIRSPPIIAEERPVGYGEKFALAGHGYLYRRDPQKASVWTRGFFFIEDSILMTTVGKAKAKLGRFEGSIRRPKANSQDAVVSPVLTRRNTDTNICFDEDEEWSRDIESIAVANLLLSTTKVMADTDADRKFCFQVVSPDKVTVLQAESEVERKDWMSVIQNATANALAAMSISKARHSIAFPADAVITGATESYETLVKRLRKLPSNSKCVDCHAPNPDWVSINLGVLFCIDCSGAHRNMGVHFSKVRSLALDRLDSVTVRMLLLLGNDVANATFDPRHTAFDGNEWRTSQAERERRIRDKYMSGTHSVFGGDSPLPKDKVHEDAVASLQDERGEMNASLSPLLNWIACGGAADEDGMRRLLHVAASSGNEEAVEFLLQNGADAETAGDDGRAAADVARDAGFDRISHSIERFIKAPKPPAAIAPAAVPDEGRIHVTDWTPSAQAAVQPSADSEDDSAVLTDDDAVGGGVGGMPSVPSGYSHHPSHAGSDAKVFEGFLKKKGDTWKNWKRRYMVLRDCVLHYYKSKEDAAILPGERDSSVRALGKIVLPSYTIEEAPSETSSPLGFKASHAGMRTYYFVADSPADLRAWIDAMNDACGAGGLAHKGK